MILDTSALLAVLDGEPERTAFEIAIAGADRRRLSSGTYLEASIVLLRRRGDGAVSEFDRWIQAMEIEIVPFTASQAKLAREAYARYSKGRHNAQLNFGDCICYALAEECGEALLYKGVDFASTDIPSALT